ncbi:MAG TPA: LamG-like jellyroll fold domain-containing protein, partial [Candidatus Binatia bacterium]|nr:LamG-like jellyroll fold domain-containing protein [Candidatus Binatia bacterium]
PVTPTNLTAEAGSSHVALSWPKDQFATSYNVYRSTAPGMETLYVSGLKAPFFADTNVVRGTTYYYQVAAVNSAGASDNSAEISAMLPALSLYSARVLADLPVAFYPLDETSGSIAYDLSGHHYDGTYTNAPSLGIAGPSGFLSGGASFNEASQWVSQWSHYQWVDLGNPAALNFSGAITLEAWVKPVYAGTPNYFENVLCRGYNTGNGIETALRLNGMDSFQIGVYSYSLGGGSIAKGSPAASAGQWVYLAGTFDGTYWNLYTNGVLAGRSPSTVGALTSTDHWAIGNGTGGGDGRFYLGPISHAAIYNYALSASQIQAHYLAGIAGTLSVEMELSGTNAVLTWPGGTLQQAGVITGPFSDVANAVSPLTLPLTATNKFFRVKF